MINNQRAFNNGKICYVGLPSIDVNNSAAFIKKFSVGIPDRAETEALHLMTL